MELKRRLYTRGSSYETTIPKPLLFSRDLTKKQLVRFIYDDEQHKWYLDFEEQTPPTQTTKSLTHNKNYDPDPLRKRGGTR